MRRLLANLRTVAQSRPWAFDVTLSAALVGCGVVSTFVVDRLTPRAEIDFDRNWALAAAVVIGGALAVRRRWPLGVLGAVSVVYAASIVGDATEGTFSSIAVFIAIYTAGAFGRRPAAHWARAACVVLMAALLAWSVAQDRLYGDIEGPDRLAAQLFVVLLNVFYFVAAWVMGELAHSRRRREAMLAAQAAELAAAHAEIARRAVGAERMRIARELHDVVAHHVSVMGVQAGAARRVLSRSPQQAAGALASIETSSREAVSELHDLLGFLRQEGDADTTAPLPTLEHLDDLVGQITDADVSVDLTMEGVDGSVPAGLDLSAYRVVQEGLTNVVKHAGPGAHASVAVRQRADALEVTVTDDGGRQIPRPDRTNGTGNGLVGMRERVALHGGVLEAGPQPGGGFAVHATFSRRTETTS